MVFVKISEHTNRIELIDSLKKTFGIKYKVFQELISNRLKEDIIIFQNDLIKLNLSNNEIFYTDNDAVVTIIETKNKGEEIESSEDQLLKYLKVFNCRIGFLCNFEDLICLFYNQDWTKETKILFRSENLDEISNHIKEFIERCKNISIKTSPEEFIKVLENSIEDLTQYTNKITGEKWAKMFKFSDFPEKEVIEKEIEPEEKKSRNRFYQRSAAYIGIAQILFYVTFRQFRLDKQINRNPELAPLSVSNGIPNQVQQLLLEIPNHNLNFKTIFGKNRLVFEKLEDDASSVINTIIHTLEGLSADFVIKNDLIGQIFQRLMPYDIRKKYAAYYTLRKAAELLCILSISNKNEIIFDPSCGSGTLLVYAYYRLKQLGLNQHEQILQQLYGSDISDIASMMSTINLAIQDPMKWINFVNIYPHDILDLVGTGLDRFFPLKLMTINQNINHQEKSKNEFPSVDVLIGNPPFTRCMRVSKKYRIRLISLSLIKKYKFKPNFKALGLYSFFLIIAPTLVKKPNGKIAFILPLGAINSEAMIDIWRILFKEDFGIKFLIMASMQDRAFSDSKGHEIMIILENGYKDKVKLIKLKGYLNNIDISQLITKIIKIEDPAGQEEDFDYIIFEQNEIKNKPCIEWNFSSSLFIQLFYSKFVSISDLSNNIKIVSQNQSRPADYWFIPNKYWEIEKDDEHSITIRPTIKNTIITKSSRPNKRITLPKEGFIKCLERSISNYNNFPPIIPSNVHHSLFLVDENRDEFKSYKLWGKKAHEEELFKSKSHSRSSVSLNRIGILQKISFKGSKTLALQFSEPLMGAGVIMFGFDSDNDRVINLLFSYLTSSLFMLDALIKARVRSGEFVRIHKVDIEKIYKFPNFNSINNNEIATNMLINASLKYNSEKTINERPFFIQKIQEARSNPNDLLRKLDEAWFEILGLPKATIDQFYQEILTYLDQYNH